MNISLIKFYLSMSECSYWWVQKDETELIWAINVGCQNIRFSLISCERIIMDYKDIIKLMEEEDDGFFSSLQEEVEKGDHSWSSEDFR